MSSRLKLSPYSERSVSVLMPGVCWSEAIAAQVLEQK